MLSAGLFDLQVNGYAGVDFNDADITADAMDHALEAMRRSGVTLCLPTIITASRDNLSARFAALDTAVSRSTLGPRMVPGYHLEGPFLNDAPGYRGCHPAEAMGDPHADLVFDLEKDLERPILLVTLAPERAGGIETVGTLTRAGKCIAIGHSAAGGAPIAAAVDAGLSLSTHLGNGLPKLLPKLDNTLLAQLAEPRLAACLIADGIHIPRDALAGLVRLKGSEKCILVSDAVVAAGAEPGRYSFAGMDIELGTDGGVREPGLSHLAGSALSLDTAVRNMASWGIVPPRTAIAMAADHPYEAMCKAFAYHQLVVEAGEIAWSSGLEPKIRREARIERP